MANGDDDGGGVYVAISNVYFVYKDKWIYTYFELDLL